MSRLERWLVHLSTLLVGGTGLVYAVMKYGMEPADPFSVVNHPLQPYMLSLHLVSAPLLVLAVGVIWKGHIAGGWRSGSLRGRFSGAGLVLTFLPMAFSGYLLQAATSLPWRRTWLIVHLASSGIWLLMFVGHQVSFVIGRFRRSRSGPADARHHLESVARLENGDDDRRQKPAA